jgi:capsular exopolysaccharide synthesis family protein
MGYVFDAMTKAGQAKRPSRRAIVMPEIETIAILPTVLREIEEKQSPEAAKVTPAPEPSAPAETAPAVVMDPKPDAAAPAAASESPSPVKPPAPLLPGADPRLVVLTDPTSTLAEEYRTIRTHLLVRCEQRRHLLHAFSSSVPAEGTTVTALNLAFALSELPDRTTVLVEANLRSPAFARLLNLDAPAGLRDILAGSAALDSCLHTVARANLSVLTAGSTANASAVGDVVQLLSSKTFADLLHDLRHRFDHVIVDAAPALDLADASIVGSLCDDLTLIVRDGSTPRPLIEKTIAQLKNSHVPLAGVVITGTDPRPARYRYGGR